MRTTPTPTRHRRGFTILEILIAIVVLVLGIMGIIALFPTAIESGNKTIEDSYASAITQSVVDALTVGLRESRYQYKGSQKTYTYFVFNHDGVIDRQPMQSGQVYPPAYSDYGNLNGTWDLQRKDWCIVLPECTVNPEPTGGNVLIQNEPIFLYPTPKTGATGSLPSDSYFLYPSAGSNSAPDQRKSSVLDAPANQIDNYTTVPAPGFFRTTNEGVSTPWIPAVYHLGRYRDGSLPSGRLPGEVRQEYRGDRLNIGTGTQETMAVDPYPTYSFAFTLQRARLDTTGATGSPDGQIDPAVDAFVSTLYQLRIMVFKNFNAQAAGAIAPSTFGKSPGPQNNPGEVVPKTNVPVKEFITLISL